MKRRILFLLSLCLLISLCACKPKDNPEDPGNVSVDISQMDPSGGGGHVDPNYTGDGTYRELDLDNMVWDADNKHYVDPDTGYVYDPSTDEYYDPETGTHFDPSTGRPLDPETGEPIEEKPPVSDTEIGKVQQEHPDTNIDVAGAEEEGMELDAGEGARAFMPQLPIIDSEDDKWDSESLREFKVLGTYSAQGSYRTVDAVDSNTKDYRDTVMKLFKSNTKFTQEHTENKDDGVYMTLSEKGGSTEARDMNHIQLRMLTEGLQMIHYTSQLNKATYNDSQVKTRVEQWAKDIRTCVGLNITADDIYMLVDMAKTIDGGDHTKSIMVADNSTPVVLQVSVSHIGEKTESWLIVATRNII